MPASYLFKERGTARGEHEVSAAARVLQRQLPAYPPEANRSADRRTTMPLVYKPHPPPPPASEPPSTAFHMERDLCSQSRLPRIAQAHRCP
jgi:hypothetical protein